MALDVSRLTDAIIQKQEDKIAALGPSPSLADVRRAFMEGLAEAFIEEIEGHLEMTVTNVQVDPQTGGQVNEAEANVPASA